MIETRSGASKTHVESLTLPILYLIKLELMQILLKILADKFEQNERLIVFRVILPPFSI